MADLNILCDKCGVVSTLSEFVDFDNITCNSCGAKLDRPMGSGEKKTHTVNRDAPSAVIVENIVASSNASQGESNVKIRNKKTEKKEVKMTHYVASWIFMIVLGFIMYMLRYADTLDTSGLKTLALIAPYITAVMHICIVVMAFKDSFIHGSLALFIPFYSLFYVFGVCDYFYFRAVVIGILIGFGQDGGMFYAKQVAEHTSIAEKWVGGGALEWRDMDEDKKKSR